MPPSPPVSAIASVRRRGHVLLCCLAVALGSAGCRPGSQSAPWPQPTSGPGGADYAHHSCSVTRGGDGDSAYTMYLPAAPTPTHAPVVVFLHGWGALDPAAYGAWLTHLARRGSIVIFPHWQSHRLDGDGRRFLTRAVAATRAALRDASAGLVKPDLQGIAFFGHSVGGTLAADLAVDWQHLRLPQPAAILCVTPGSLSVGAGFPIANDVPLADFSRLPDRILLAVVTAEDDVRVRSVIADRLWEQAARLPASQRLYLRLRSDAHGQPPLLADHRLPLGDAVTGRDVDAMDYALWGLGDRLLAAGRGQAGGEDWRKLDLGAWPDGTAIRAPVIIR